jgi:hypothetical protein
VIEQIGATRIAAIVSDSASAVKRARQIALQAIPFAVDLHDCCHVMHNTIKDITRLDEFKMASIILFDQKVGFHMVKSTDDICNV